MEVDYEERNSGNVDGRSDVAGVLDRAGAVQTGFGWLMGSWILLRAIGAADKKRSIVSLGVLASVLAAALKVWL